MSWADLAGHHRCDVALDPLDRLSLGLTITARLCEEQAIAIDQDGRFDSALSSVEVRRLGQCCAAQRALGPAQPPQSVAGAAVCLASNPSAPFHCWGCPHALSRGAALGRRTTNLQSDLHCVSRNRTRPKYGRDYQRGLVKISPGYSTFRARSLRLQSGGKIVVGGIVDTGGGNE